MTLKMLPPAPSRCPICAAEHGPDEGHDCSSTYYQLRFRGLHGRWPTWADAVAHLGDEHRKTWVTTLRGLGLWTEPEGGAAPIAEPVTEEARGVVELGGGPMVLDMSDWPESRSSRDHGDAAGEDARR